MFPVLSILTLNGVTEYLDQLLAHIEAPHLNDVQIGFLDPPIFDISRLSPCIGHTETFDQACMYFHYVNLSVELSSRKGTTNSTRLILSLRWKDSGWKLEKLSWRPSPPCSFVYISEDQSLPPWIIDMGITPWLEFLHVFTTVENLYLSTGIALRIASALRELAGEGVTEVLPALQNIFIRPQTSEAETIQEVMGKFIAARELSGHPVTVNIVQCYYIKVV